MLTNLKLEPGSRLIVAPGTRLFIKTTLIYRGTFSNSAGQLASTFVAYYGSADAFLESNFSGTFLAQSAAVILGDSDSLTYSGTVLAKNIEVRPDVTLSCVAGTSQQLAKSLQPAAGEVSPNESEASLAAPELKREAVTSADDSEQPNVTEPASTCTIVAVGSSSGGPWWALLALLLLRRRRASARARGGS